MNNYRKMLLIRLSRFSEQYSRYTQREQLIITGALIALCVGVFNFLVFEVINNDKNIIDIKMQETKKEITQINNQLSRIRSGSNLDPNLELKRQIDSLQSEIYTYERTIAERTGSMVKPAEVMVILSGILKRRKDIEILNIKTSPSEDVTPKKQKDLGQTGLLFRHTWEFSLKGSYRGLMAYFKAVEELRQGLIWGEVKLVNESYPILEANVRVHTFSSQDSALGV